MEILTTKGWADYELLDSGNGERLERFGKYTLIKPDPQCIWVPHIPEERWRDADAYFYKSQEERGNWEIRHTVPASWTISYKELKFILKLTPFKHTGIFPEQHVQWDWIQEKIRNPASPAGGSKFEIQNQPNILNLFAYTGGATLAAAAAGAKVTHVDASKSTITWARENQSASGLSEKPVRWILDDAGKFVSREVKRGVRYDGIILDPPIYGHGPNGETWDLMRDLPNLLRLCKQVLSDKPLFVLVNAYAVSASAIMISNLLEDIFGRAGSRTTCGELALQESTGTRLLSTGILGRWEKLS